jgi:hypothetical protein
MNGDPIVPAPAGCVITKHETVDIVDTIAGMASLAHAVRAAALIGSC